MRYYSATASLLLLALLCGAFQRATAQTAEDLLRLVDKWVQLRSQTHAERSVWQERQGILQSEKDLLDREIAVLHDKLQSSEDNLTGAEGDLTELESEKQRLETALSELFPVVERSQTQWCQLVDRLPEPLNLRQHMPDSGLPAASSAGTLQIEDLGRNVQILLRAYAEVQAANLDEHSLPIMLTAPDGVEREMDGIFLGTATAFAVSRDGRFAAAGQPAASGWIWNWEVAAPAQVRKALRVHAGDEPAQLVDLPLQLGEQ